MGRLAVEPSRQLAGILRDRRLEFGWTLRDVEKRTRSLGRPIPFSTIARIERGDVDPGIRRLHVLFKVYDLPPKLVEDLVEIEEFAGEVPADVSVASLHENALRSWRAGDLRQALGGLALLRAKIPDDPSARRERQKSLLSLAVAIGSLGRYRLSRYLVEELLLESPEPEFLVPALVQAANCWHRLGSGTVALGFLATAEAQVSAGEHRSAALVRHARATTLTSLGRLDDAERALERALGEYRKAGDPFGEGQALGERVRIRLERKDLKGALKCAREAREHAESKGHGRLLAQGMLEEGRVLLALGRHEEALAALSTGLAQAVATQDPVTQFFGHYYLWKAHAESGDAKRADMERNAARYFVEFVDAAVPEAVEVRVAETAASAEPAESRRKSGRIPAERA